MVESIGKAAFWIGNQAGMHGYTGMANIKGPTVRFVKSHPKASLGAAMMVAAGMVRHHNTRKLNKLEGKYRATIQTNSRSSYGEYAQSAPQGSAAGMNNGSSAWVQMNGQGYSNQRNQLARYNASNSPQINYANYRTTHTRTVPNGRMVSYAGPSSNVNDDYKLSKQF